MTLKIFIGYDKRQPLAFNVCRSSIERRASSMVDIVPLMLEWMPVKRRGLTDFTFTRYLVPHLSGYMGDAIFLDPDTIVLDDIWNIFKDRDVRDAVSVVKNPLRFEWPSVMVFNNARCDALTLDLIENGSPHKFEWAQNVGELPKEWNHLVGYDAPNPNAKIVHFTRGIPCWPETNFGEYAQEWCDEANYANSTVSWHELMGGSVHAKHMPKKA
jgi:hypothetical protein